MITNWCDEMEDDCYILQIFYLFCLTYSNVLVAESLYDSLFTFTVNCDDV